MKAFLDTNILIYCIDPSDPGKRRRAKNLLGRAGTEYEAVLSTQVCLEFYAVATRKLGLPPEAAKIFIRSLERFEIVTVEISHIHHGIDLSSGRAFSIWDGLILAAALSARCSLVYSEDMQHGQKVEGVMLENPFLEV